MLKPIARYIVINYLKFLTYIKLKLFFKGKIIGVAGCFGKSSTVNLICTVFSQQYRTFTTTQNGRGLNSETGIPFALLGVKVSEYNILSWCKYLFASIPGVFKKLDYEFLVLEMGIDKPGDMKFLTSFLIPNTGLLINSNNSHSVYFDKLHITHKKSYEQLIAEENGYVFERSRDNIIYNVDDPEVIAQIPRFTKGDKYPFSLHKTHYVKNFTPTLGGTDITLEFQGSRYSLQNPHPLLEEYKGSFEIVLKLAELYNLSVESVINGMKNFSLPPGRSMIFKGVQGSYILDSSYNGPALTPMAASLRMTAAMAKGRKIAVLGDMRELGDLTEMEHEKLALVASETMDIVVTVGPAMMKYFKPEFESVKSPGQELYSFATTKEALNFLQKNEYAFIQKDDLILVKGSQNTLLLEIIVENLLANPTDAHKLCRRDPHYQKAREKLLA